ncbi:MAG: serine protease [Bdellovibrionota bacterium]
MRFGKLIKIFSFFFVLVGCGSEYSSENTDSLSLVSSVIGENDLMPVRTDRSNLPLGLHFAVGAIGQMSNNCTAFHLGSGLVATAGHCVADDYRPEQRIPCQNLSIKWGKTGNLDFSEESHCIEVIDRRYDTDGDYAFLRVDPYPVEVLELSPIENSDGRNITVLGYPNGRNLEWSKYCTLQKNDTVEVPAGFTHTCDTERGNSGSPVLDAHTFKVLGIHNGGRVNENYGTLIQSVPYAAAFKKAASSNKPEDGWDGRRSVSFGPFENNENRLLMALEQSEGERVSFMIEFDIEEPYDQLVVSDSRGRKYNHSGNGAQTFEGMETPVTVAFKSDYAGPSNKVIVKQIIFGHE